MCTSYSAFSTLKRGCSKTRRANCGESARAAPIMNLPSSCCGVSAKNAESGRDQRGRLSSFCSPRIPHHDESGPIERMRISGVAQELQLRALEGLGSAERRTALLVGRLSGAMEGQHHLCGASGFHLPLTNYGSR